MRNILLNLFSHHTLYLLRVDLHFLAVRFRNVVGLLNTNRIKTDARYLNLACGPHGLQTEEWFNLDGWQGAGIDFAADLRKNLPFTNGRFQGIFCEHFFEHLTPHDREGFLHECLRILKPGGTLRISVPNGALYMENYFKDRDWMAERRGGKHTPMAVVNEVFRQRYEHEYCYDGDTLLLVLDKAGFKECQIVQFHEGEEAALLIDQDSRSFESLYAECKK